MIEKNKSVIKASFKDCPIEDRKKFGSSNCIVPISVGQAVHEGEKFAATLNLLNRSFSECTILIDDTIQWHTYKIEAEEQSDTYLYNFALKEGDLWLQRNLEIINQHLTIPHKIIRWEHWSKHPEYANQRAKVEEWYSHNSEYKSAIDSNIATFLSRYQSKNDNQINYSNAFKYCLEYLKEECACMCLWAMEGYHFEVYPTGRNEAMSKTHDLFILATGLLKSVSIRFKKHILKQALVA